MTKEEKNTARDYADAGGPPAWLFEEMGGGDLKTPDSAAGVAEEALDAGGPPAWLTLTEEEEMEGTDSGTPGLAAGIAEEALDAGGPPAWLVEEVEGGQMNNDQ